MSASRAFRSLSKIDWATIVVGGLLVGLTLVVFPPPPGSGPNLELSWKEAYAYFLKHSFQCGKDYIFTFGPLGHFAMQTYDPDLFWATYAGNLVLTAALTAIFIGFSLRLRPLVRLAFLICFVATQSLMNVAINTMLDPTITFAIVAGFVSLTAGDQNASIPRQLGFVAFLAVLALIKINLLVLGILAVALLAILQLSRGHYRMAGGIGLTYVACFLSGWLLAGQRAANIPAFFDWSAELTSGYSEAMSLSNVVPPLFLGIVAAIAFVVALVPRSRAEFRILLCPHTAAAISLLALAAAMTWKHAFTRMDSTHVRNFFRFAAVAVFVPLVVLDQYDWKRIYRLAPLCVCGLASLIAFFEWHGPLATSQALPAAFGESLFYPAEYVVDPPKTRERLDRGRAFGDEFWKLPRIKAAVGDKTVDLLGHFQGFIFRNQLNWKPRPVFQSYSAYTPRLLRANADFFREAQNPDYVMLKMKAIDGRVPSAEDSSALLEILWRYEPVLIERSFLLVKRRVSPETRTPRVVVDRTIRFNETIDLDEKAADCQTISLKINLSSTGVLAKLAYQAPPLLLKLHTSSGAVATFRLIRRTAEEDFLVNPLMVDDLGLFQFFSKDPGDRVTSFELDCPMNSCYDPEVRLVVKQFPKPSSAKLYFDDIVRLAASPQDFQPVEPPVQ